MDIDFVRKAVRSIGRLAIKVEAAADDCIQALLDLIDTGVTYVVQEAIIVIKDIFRRYPGKYEGIIPTLCEHLDVLDEPEARAAMIWILGQFADRIENADDLLDALLDNFLDESVEVRSFILWLMNTFNVYASAGSALSIDRSCQVIHLQIQIRNHEGTGPQSTQVGDGGSRQPRLTRSRFHVLETPRLESRRSRRNRSGRETTNNDGFRPDGSRCS